MIYVLNLPYSFTLLVWIVLSLRLLPFRRSMAPVYFVFALVSFLMSGLYWLAYDLLRQDLRMPFAANEFGEIACFLLLASTLNVVFQGRFAAARAEMICAGLFAAASTLLWIGWSGEWLEDILVGLSLGSLYCSCVRSLKQAEALSGWEWRLFGGCAGLLLLLQGATFALPEPWRSAADWAAYVVMFSVLLLILVKLLRGMRKKQTPAALLALAATLFSWCISTMYMSSGVFYYIAMYAVSLSLLLMLLALRREGAAE